MQLIWWTRLELIQFIRSLEKTFAYVSPERRTSHKNKARGPFWVPFVFRMLFNFQTLKSLWTEDTEMEEFDPFDVRIPGRSVSERLRYLFLQVIVQQRPNEWRRPDHEKTKVLALKCLYAAMIGFNRDNLPLLFPAGIMSDSLDHLWLTKAQHTEGSSVRDRCCGHVFEKGETYYRCKHVPILRQN